MQTGGGSSPSPSAAALRAANARLVVRRQRRAQRLAKQDGIDLLLFVGDEALPMLAVTTRQKLDKRSLPPPLDLAWVKEYGALEGPQPDHLFGYCHWKHSDATTAAFSVQHEYRLLSRAVALGLYFPSLSAQWKRPKNNQRPFEARPRSTITHIFHALQFPCS